MIRVVSVERLGRRAQFGKSEGLGQKQVWVMGWDWENSALEIDGETVCFVSAGKTNSLV